MRPTTLPTGSISLASPAAENQSRNCRATARWASEKKVHVKTPVDSDQWARSSARSRMRLPSASRSSIGGEPFKVRPVVVSRESFGKSGIDVAWKPCHYACTCLQGDASDWSRHKLTCHDHSNERAPGTAQRSEYGRFRRGAGGHL